MRYDHRNYRGRNSRAISPNHLRAMTPESQRVAIAEACGYKITLDEEGVFYTLWSPEGKKLYGSNSREGLASGSPDYLSDLNAMHEAVKTLDFDGQASWQRWLLEAVNDAELWCPLANASAPQRAEAFLRSKKLWVEEAQP